MLHSFSLIPWWLLVGWCHVNDGTFVSESWKSKTGAALIIWVPEVTSFQPLSSWGAPFSHLISTESTVTPFITVRFLKLQMEMVQIICYKWPSRPSAPGNGGCSCLATEDHPSVSRQTRISVPGWYLPLSLLTLSCLCLRGLFFMVSTFIHY